MNLIFVMSISGSIVFLLYLLMKPYSNRRLTARWQYSFLKICLLFYLIPYQCFQDEYLKFYNRNFGTGENCNPLRGETLIFESKNTIYITPDGRLHYEYWQPLLAIILLWLLIAVVLLFFHIRKYRSFRKNLLMISEAPDEKLADTAVHCQSTVFPKTKKQKRILECSFVKSPLAIGLFHPAIILPKQDNSDDSSLYLMHELYHIKNHDIVWKFIAFFTILLHWYNPLVYLLFLEICSVSEKYCDEQVTSSLNETQKTHYGNLIIEAAQNQNDTTILLADSFIKNKKQAKERILFMTRKPRKSTQWKLITALVICLAVLSMPISVLAYQPFYTYHDTEYHPHTDIMYLMSEEDEDPFGGKYTTAPTDNLDFTLSDDILIDESGNQYPIIAENQQTAKSCSHEFVQLTKAHHVRSSKGCTVSTYEGTYCKYCGYCLQETFVSKTTYATCPH